MAGEVRRVQLGLELWSALAKRQRPITGPLGAMVMDCAHGEYHFKTPVELGRLIRDLPVLAKVKQKIKETLPHLPSAGGSLWTEGPGSEIDESGIFGGILGFEPNLGDGDMWSFSLSD